MSIPSLTAEIFLDEDQTPTFSAIVRCVPSGSARRQYQTVAGNRPVVGNFPFNSLFHVQLGAFSVQTL
jgi:hypothetical protein